MGWFSSAVSSIGNALNDALDVVVDLAEDLGGEIKDALGLSFEETEAITGVLLNKASATAKIPQVYGERRVGGVRVFMHTQGDKNNYLYTALVLSEGQVYSIKDIEVNDESLSDYGSVSSSKSGNNYYYSVSGVARISALVGSWSQSADANFVSDLGNLWTSNHTLTGVAALLSRYTYNADHLSSLPQVTAVVKGRLLDVRTGNYGASSNAALVIYDYMKSGVYGESILDEEINLESFKTAADQADRLAVNYVGATSSYRPLNINGVIDTGKSRLDNIRLLLSHARASLPYIAGQYHLVIRSQTASSFEFNDDHIIGDISISSASASNKCNRVTVTFVDPALFWRESTVTYPVDDGEYQQFLSDDNNIEKHDEITANMITNKYQALDFARQYLYESRQALTIGFKALPSARSVLPGRVVTVNTSQLGSFLFSVEKRVVASDGTYTFTLKEYNPSIYSWINPTEIETGETPTLPNPYNLPPVTGLVFSPVSYNDTYQGVLSWNESQSAFVTRYQVHIYNTLSGVLAWSSTVQSDKVNVPNLPAGSYRAEIKGLSELSSTTLEAIEWVYSVPVLPIVMGLKQVGVFDAELNLAWDAVSDKQALRSYKVELLNTDSDLVIFSQNAVSESITIPYSQFEILGFPRHFEVQVSATNVALSHGPAASVIIDKPAPAAPLSVSVLPDYDALDVRVLLSSGAYGVCAWLDTSLPVNQDALHQVYKGELGRFDVRGLTELTAYRLAIACYDAFGVGAPGNYSATTLQDTVSQSVQQLIERDLTLEADAQALAQQVAENAASAAIKTDEVAEAVLNAAVAKARIEREQLSQNDEYYRILNAVVEIDPSTGTITSRASEYTNGKFSEAAILIDGVNAAVLLQADRITTTQNSVESTNSQLNVLAGEISQRATYTEVNDAVAGAIDAIQPSYVTNFNSGLDGWSALAGTSEFNPGQYIDLTLGDISTALGYDGGENPVIQLVLSRDEAATWAGVVQYQTAEHGYSALYQLPIAEINPDGQQYTVIVDFTGVEDYTSNMITGLHIVLGSSIADVFTLHSVQAGRKTAAQIALDGLQGRVTQAEQSINAVTGTLEQYVTTTWYSENALTESSVNSVLNSWDSTHKVLATLTQMNSAGTIEKANSASTWIDGADAYIQNIASNYIDNGVGLELTEVKQILDAQAGVISSQVVAMQQVDQAVLDTEEAQLNAALSQAAGAREQVSQADSLAVAKRELKATADEQSALALSVTELTAQVGENQSNVTEYQRAAIGYCVDAQGNPTSHETAAACELITGHSWVTSNLAEALKKVTITAKNDQGEAVLVNAGSLYQVMIDDAQNAAATAAIVAQVNEQLAGVFANVGIDGSSLDFLADQMRFKTQNGTATPFEIDGEKVYANDLIVRTANIEDAAIDSAKIAQATIQAAHIVSAAIKSAHIASAAIQAAHIGNAQIKAAHISNAAIGRAHIANAAIGAAQIQNAAISSAKIGDEIKSNNFVSGKSGWRILKSGLAEFNGPVISRELSVKSGTKSFGKIDAKSESLITLLREEIIDTGYPSSSWSGTKFYTTCDAGFVSTSVAVYSSYKSTAAWGVTADILPLTRWSSTATVHLIIRIYGRRVRYLKPVSVKWRLLRMS